MVATMRAASSRESTSVSTKADSISPRSKRREGALSAGGSNWNDGEHHMTAAVLVPVESTLWTTGGSWVVGGPRLTPDSRCALLPERSGAELRAAHACTEGRRLIIMAVVHSTSRPKVGGGINLPTRREKGGEGNILLYRDSWSARSCCSSYFWSKCPAHVCSNRNKTYSALHSLLRPHATGSRGCICPRHATPRHAITHACRATGAPCWLERVKKRGSQASRPTDISR